MSAMRVAEHMTADEHLALPLEDRRTQLIDGVIVATEPNPLHQAVLGVLVVRRSVPAATTFDASLELVRGDTLAYPAMPGFAVALDALFTESAG